MRRGPGYKESYPRLRIERAVLGSADFNKRSPANKMYSDLASTEDSLLT